MAEEFWLETGRISGNRARGQAIPLDFMSGMFIFMVTLTYFIVLWNIFSMRYVEHADALDMESHAISIAESLVSSPGTPFNWTESPLSAQSIGIASRPNYLDPYRISALESLPYANAKRLLGTDYDFLIKIDSGEGARYATVGQEPSNTTRIVEVTRAASYQGSTAFVRVQLYE